MRVDSVTGSIRQQLKPVLDSPFTLPAVVFFVLHKFFVCVCDHT